MDNLIKNGIVPEEDCKRILDSSKYNLEFDFSFEEMQLFLIKRGYTIFTHKVIYRPEIGRIWAEEILILAVTLESGMTFFREKVYAPNDTEEYLKYKAMDIRSVFKKELKRKILE